MKKVERFLPILHDQNNTIALILPCNKLFMVLSGFTHGFK